MLTRLKSRMVRAFYPYGSIRTVLRGPVRGRRFVVRPAMGFTYSIGVDGQHMRYFVPRVHPGDCVYDVGANRGHMMLLLANLVGQNGRVVSFEPVPSLYEDLCRNQQLNRLAQVRCIQAAVSMGTGTATFQFGDAHPTQGKLRDVEPGYQVNDIDEFTVPTLSLDELIATGERPPQLIKIDVEGGAAGVLAGAQDCLQIHRPALFVELHGSEEQQALQDVLTRHKYLAQTLAGRPITDVTAKWENPLWCWPTEPA